MIAQKEVFRQLAVGKKGHKDVSDRLMALVRLSRDRMSTRYAALAQNEEQYSAYVPAREVDEARKTKKRTLGEHDYVSIEVPYTYAVLMTIHTYISSVFLSRNPVYQVSGRHGETEQSTQSMEALLDYQLIAGQHVWPLHCALFDPLRYGYSVLWEYWDREEINTRAWVKRPKTFMGFEIPGAEPETVAEVTKTLGYQGTKLFNVRPQDFFPDPRVPIVRFQEGEFVARYVEIPWSKLRDGEAVGEFFNVQEARKGNESSGQAASQRDAGSSAVTVLPGDPISTYMNDAPSSYFEGYEVIWSCRPHQWKLGDETGLEKWVFTISTSGVIVEARPLGLLSSKFPCSVFVTEPEAYSLFPISALERVKPMNDVLSWLINTHFYNVRAALNNQFVVDPQRVVMKDVLSRTPGQLIRLKPEAYGTDVRTAITQLPVSDITRANLSDAQVVEMMIQRTLGATDNVMGMVNTGGRKTATEVRTSTSFGVNRIKTVCELLGASGFAQHMQNLIQQTQQFYQDEGLRYKLVGDLSALDPQSRNITPESIAGFYDYVPVDGTLPVDRYAQAQLWQTLLGQVRQLPQVMQQYDIAKIFAWVGTLAGLKNMQQFRMQIMPQDPAMLAQQVQAGNMVPVGDAMKDLSRVPDAGRPANMGATG